MSNFWNKPKSLYELAEEIMNRINRPQYPQQDVGAVQPPAAGPTQNAGPLGQPPFSSGIDSSPGLLTTPSNNGTALLESGVGQNLFNDSKVAANTNTPPPSNDNTTNVCQYARDICMHAAYERNMTPAEHDTWRDSCDKAYTICEAFARGYEYPNQRSIEFIDTGAVIFPYYSNQGRYMPMGRNRR